MVAREQLSSLLNKLSLKVLVLTTHLVNDLEGGREGGCNDSIIMPNYMILSTIGALLLLYLHVDIISQIL